MPKVSVIIPVYNTEKYLRQCLDSVVNQTLKDIEIICVDDGSTDGSVDLINEYIKNDSRIVLISQKNQGPSVARENGVNAAKGEYVGFVDSDDFIAKDYYELLYKHAVKFDADISMTDDIILYDKGIIGRKKCGVCSKDKLITSNIQKRSIIVTSGICWNKIYKKSFIDKYNLRPAGSAPGADNIFNATTVIKANKIAVSHKAKYYYVQLSDSIVHKLKDKSSFNIVNNYKFIDNWIDSQTDLTDFDKRYWKYVNMMRKRRDFDVFYRSMAPEFKEEFKLLCNKNIVIYDLIVSLTSYPARINTVHYTIESLLNQSIKPEKIILWLAEEQFPNKEKDLPSQLLNLCQSGLTLEWYHDIKSYKKIIPALHKYPNKVIITADDDVIYHKECLERLYVTYLKFPNTVVCHRGHYILFDPKTKNIMPYRQWIFECGIKIPSYNIVQTGVGTVLYPPKCFYKDVLNEDLFTSLAYNTDDLWLWAMCVLNNTKIVIAQKNISNLDSIFGTQEDNLYLYNMEQGNNITMKKIFEYYPQILGKLDKNAPLSLSFLEKIFSVKNEDERKVITILGIKIKIKSKNLVLKNRLNRLERRLMFTEGQLECISKRLSVLESSDANKELERMK